MSPADLNYMEQAARDWHERNTWPAYPLAADAFALFCRDQAEDADTLDFSLRSLWNVWLELP